MKSAMRAVVAGLVAGLCSTALGFTALAAAQAAPNQGAAASAAPGATTPSQAKAAAPPASGAAIAKSNAPAPLTLPAGAMLHVRLTTTLTSKTNKTGDKFTGIIDDPLTISGKTVVPGGSLVEGHVAFVKPSKRIKGVAQMRVLLDTVTTPDDLRYNLTGTLEDAQGSACGKTGSDNEGTIKGCGKSKKGAAEATAIAAGVGAGTGATIGLGHEIDCRYYGNCGGAGMGTDVMYGAGIGAATGLIYSIFKHEKDLILVEGTDLTFVVNRSVEAKQLPASASSSLGQ